MFLHSLLLLSVLPAMFSLAYIPIMSFLAKGRDLSTRNIEDVPEISVIIPTFNEEENITKKIENLKGIDYPYEKIEVFVIDGGSDDSTTKLAKKHNVEVIKIGKRGKIKAINTGLERCSNDIVLLTDCDVFLGEETLRKSVKYLGDDVGAVSVPVKPISEKGKLLADCRDEYYEDEWVTRYRESVVSSACSLDGKFILLRSDLIDRIEDGYTDDFKLTLQLREKEYTSVVPRGFHIEEVGEETLLGEVNKMRRTCRLAIATSISNLRNVYRDLDLYSMLIFPCRRLLNFFVPMSISFPLIYILYTLPTVLPLFIIFDIILSLSKKEFLYYHILLISLSLAWFDIFTGNLKRGCRWGY